MKMLITKQETKPHIIRYVRDDGSDTWMKASDYFVRHDLSHFALEKTLGYKTAFMGMLNAGMDVRDFENREKRLQIAVTAEASYAENMANLFLLPPGSDDANAFNQLVSDAYTDMQTGFPPPRLTAAEIAAVKAYLHRLLLEWQALPAGDTLALEFDTAASAFM